MRRRPTAPPDPAQCYDAALRLLSYRFRGSKELRRKLRDKGFDDAAIGDAIERLTRERWLDDKRFAVAYARTRFQKLLGGRRVVSELRELGIDEHLAADALIAAAEDEPEDVRLRELAEKRVRILVRAKGREFAESDEGRQRLIGWIMKQGYGYGAASAVVREVVKSLSS
jgi:regulatory protein